MSSILEIHNLKKRFFYNQQSFEILSGITFAFQKNISYSITGPSGCGKSTLLHLIAGIENPTQGNIFFNGQNLNKNYLLDSIGIVFQEPYLIKELTILENIMLKGLLKNESYLTCKNQALELLKKINLLDKANQLPATLSIGQQQRIAILRAIFNKPEFLLADEPTANLDENNAKIIINLLQDCMREWGMGLIIITHDHKIIDSTNVILKLQYGLLSKTI